MENLRLPRAGAFDSWIQCNRPGFVVLCLQFLFTCGAGTNNPCQIWYGAALPLPQRCRSVHRHSLHHLYYHRPTFLQNFIVDFFLHVPLPSRSLESTQSESKHYRSMTVFFYFKTKISCYCLLNTLDLPFCNLFQAFDPPIHIKNKSW